MNDRKRQPKGVRTGGQFAAESRSDDVELFEVVGEATVTTVPSEEGTDAAFFFERAAWSYDPACETSEEGRLRTAQELASADKRLRDAGWTYLVEPDPDADFDDDVDRDTTDYDQWQVTLVDAAGRERFEHSLGGIDLGPDGVDTDPYFRVVAAELAREIPQGEMSDLGEFTIVNGEDASPVLESINIDRTDDGFVAQGQTLLHLADIAGIEADSDKFARWADEHSSQVDEFMSERYGFGSDGLDPDSDGDVYFERELTFGPDATEQEVLDAYSRDAGVNRFDNESSMSPVFERDLRTRLHNFDSSFLRGQALTTLGGQAWVTQAADQVSPEFRTATARSVVNETGGMGGSFIRDRSDDEVLVSKLPTVRDSRQVHDIVAEPQFRSDVADNSRRAEDMVRGHLHDEIARVVDGTGPQSASRNFHRDIASSYPWEATGRCCPIKQAEALSYELADQADARGADCTVTYSRVRAAVDNNFPDVADPDQVTRRVLASQDLASKIDTVSQWVESADTEAATRAAGRTQR